MKKWLSLPVVRRGAICKSLGLLFGLVCFWLSQRTSPLSWDWGNPLLWSMIINRLLIGVVVFFAGFMTIHPCWKFRLHPAMRGAIVGLVVSLDIAVGVFMDQSISIEIQKTVFLMTLFAGAGYGIIIDMVATKFGGEGKDLMKTL